MKVVAATPDVALPVVAGPCDDGDNTTFGDIYGASCSAPGLRYGMREVAMPMETEIYADAELCVTK